MITTKLTVAATHANGVVARITVEILKAGFKPLKQTVQRQGDNSIIFFEIKSNYALTEMDYLALKNAVPEIQDIRLTEQTEIQNHSQEYNDADMEQQVLDSIARMEKQQKDGLF